MRNKYKILLLIQLGDLHTFEIIILKWILKVICKCELNSADAGGSCGVFLVNTVLCLLKRQNLLKIAMRMLASEEGSLFT